MIKDPNSLKAKPVWLIAKEKGIICEVEGCDSPLTTCYGPGNKTLCREHQRQLNEHGGNAYANRKYTYHKKDQCEKCGYNPYKDTERFEVDDFENENDMKRCQNKLLSVDHKDGNHDNNSPENCQTLCHTCHHIKTHINKDWQFSKKASE